MEKDFLMMTQNPEAKKKKKKRRLRINLIIRSPRSNMNIVNKPQIMEKKYLPHLLLTIMSLLIR